MSQTNNALLINSNPLSLPTSASLILNSESEINPILNRSSALPFVVTITPLNNSAPSSPVGNKLSNTPTSSSGGLVSSNSSITPLNNNASSIDLTGRFLTGQTHNISFNTQGVATISGNLTLVVTNRGSLPASGLFTVRFFLSSDNTVSYTPNGLGTTNDILLDTQVVNSLGAGASTNLSLSYNQLTSVIAPGAYQIVAQIDSSGQITESNENNNVVGQLVSAPGTDVVIDWNSTVLNVIQAEGSAGRGIGPTFGSRLLAMFSTAMYDTFAAFNNSITPYAIDVNAPAGTNVQAAIVGAAARILLTQTPGQFNLINQQVTKSLGELPGGVAGNYASYQFGQSVANQILALRANDGSNNNTAYSPPASPPNGPSYYVWRPGADGFALGPNWGSVTRWLPGTSAFTVGGLDGTPTNNPTLYATEINEVQDIGGVISATRTADQTQIALFWSYDRPDTFRPYGQLNQLTQQIAIREGNTLEQNIRLFAALHTAFADGVITAWGAKYQYVQPRPIDVIAGTRVPAPNNVAIADIDGVAATTSDPTWQPLLNIINNTSTDPGRGTPPFPDYISGHSTFSGAWAGVLSSFFGDDYNFSAVSQELPDVVRSYSGIGTFQQAAAEDAISRVYGGVHVREATVTDALPIGLSVGQFAANFFLNA